MTVSRSGGTFDGTYFTISSINIVNDKMGKFSYNVPSYNMSGSVTVVITDNEITLHDSNGSNYIYVKPTPTSEPAERGSIPINFGLQRPQGAYPRPL